jgi:hypothetical protein
VEGSAPSGKKEEMSKAQPSEKNKDDDPLGRARALLGNHAGRAALRREQREQVESNDRDRKTRATVKEGETDHRRYKHSPRKISNVGTFTGYSERRALGRE